MVRVRGAERQKKEKASAVSVEAFRRRSERTPVSESFVVSPQPRSAAT